MYLIVLNFDMDSLNRFFVDDVVKKAQVQIEQSMMYPFKRIDTFSYIGDENINVVHCVLEMQRLAQKLSWFEEALLDSKLLRVESIEDLTVSIK